MQLGNETLTPDQLASAAGEVDELRETMLDVANATFDGSYVFGGTADDVSPFNDSTYRGSATGRTVSVGDTADVETLSGEEVFGATGADVMRTLENLSGHLRAGDHDSVRAELDNLASGMSDISAARQRVGHQLETIDHARAFSESMITQNDIEVSNLTDADFADAVSRMQQARVTYEASVEIASRTNELSNLFLRL